MTNTSVNATEMIWDNILILVTVLGLGGSAGGALEPTRTVAPWCREMQIRSEGVPDPPEGKFSFLL